VPDVDALSRDAFIVDGDLGDLLKHLDAVGDAAEHRVLIVERRLIGEHDEELGACRCPVSRARERPRPIRASSSARALQP